jgi:hypothetical protein
MLMECTQMKIYSLARVLILSTFTQISFAEEAAENNSGVSGQVRYGYSNTEDSSGQNVDTAAIGGSLGYVSPVWKGISVGATAYTTHAIGSFDDDALFLDSNGAPNGKGYSIAGELWLQTEFANTAIKIGRQAIDTPFADTDDIGMIPNTFEAVVVSNNSLANTTITAMHLNKAAGVDAAVPEKFTHLTDTGDAVNALGVVYESDKWNAQLWQYDQDNQAGNATDISYLEVGASLIENLDLGLQYTTQDYDAGGKGKAWGATAAYTWADFTVSADYNKVSGANGVQGAVGGVGGGPFFTSAEQNTIDDVADISAKAIGVEYSGIKDLTLAVRKISFDQGVTDELDVTASYQIRDNLSADLIYSDMETDGKNTRFFVNYDFDI